MISYSHLEVIEMTTALAGCALSTAGLYAAIGLLIAGSSVAAPVLLISVPVGAAMAIGGSKR